MRSTAGVRPTPQRPRWRLHRASLLVLLLVAACTLIARLSVRHLVDQHEEDLLRREASSVTLLLKQLGTNYESDLTRSALIADIAGGDPARFGEAVAAAGTGGRWALYRADATGLALLSEIDGPLGDLSQPPAHWEAGVAKARTGFAVLGLVGEGEDRRLALAAGADEYLAYQEIPLLAAAASSTTGSEVDSGSLDNLDIAIYVGPQPSPEGLVFQTSEPGPEAVTEVVDVGGNQITLVVGAHDAIGGSLVGRWPAMVIAMGAIAAIGLATTVELIQRRRDDALSQVRDLAEKNAALDRALRDLESAQEQRASLEAEVRQMQRLESVGQLAGGVAHDFNNLLAAILSYADLLDDEVEGEAKTDLHEIRQAARRGADLTRRLLQFSRQDPEESVPVDVARLLQGLAHLVRRSIGEDRSLQLRLSQSSAVLTDPRALEQAVLNLAINARDATEPGGTITIATTTVTVSADDAARFPGLEPGPHVLITVEDDGAGMPAEVVERAFDPFFTTKGRAQGTGLGLATVYGTIQRSGGHVSLASVEGAGSTVSILLPITDLVPTDADRDPAAGSLVPGAGRILLVEDEPAVRSGTRRVLERAGYDVVEAVDGATAITVGASLDLDLLITDIVMPGHLNGADVVTELRAHHPSLPVLFVTGYGEDILAERGLSTDGPGAALLQKPFSAADLEAAVDELLHGAQL